MIKIIASMNGDKDMVKLLIENGAHVNLRNSGQVTALIIGIAEKANYK